MPKLRSFKGKEIIKLLTQHQFQAIRQEGSHVRLKHPDGRATTVPVHGSETIGRGLLRKIIRDTQLPQNLFR